MDGTLKALSSGDDGSLRQLLLPFLRTSLPPSRENFVLGECNRKPLFMIDHPDLWPGNILNLWGPPGSGKTHLAHIFSQTFNAPFMSLEDFRFFLSLPEDAIHRKAIKFFVFDDIDFTDQDLYNLFNMANGSLGGGLIVSRLPLMAEPNRLPDVQSRIAAIGEVALDRPEEGVLKMVLEKAFARGGVVVQPGISRYLLSRIPRSFRGALKVADILIHGALEKKTAITYSLVRQFLEKSF